MKHTPGPWERSDFGEVYAPDGGQTSVAMVLMRGQEGQANACLISAAPEMHAALGRARSALMWIINYDSDDKVLAKAINGINTALAKADRNRIREDRAMEPERMSRQQIEERIEVINQRIARAPHWGALLTALDEERKILRLRAALKEITEIEDDLFSGDWAEIEKARGVAAAALAVIEQKPDYAQELVDQAQALNLGYGHPPNKQPADPTRPTPEAGLPASEPQK